MQPSCCKGVLDGKRSGDPYGTRTRVARMKTWSPRPLDEGVGFGSGRKNGDPYGTRTRVARMKTWSPRPLDEGVVFQKRARTIAERTNPAIVKTRFLKARFSPLPALLHRPGLATCRTSHPGCLSANRRVLRLYPLNLIRIMPAQGSVECDQALRTGSGRIFFSWRNEMKLIINGESHEHTGNGRVEDLLDELGANKAHTALMVNGEVIPSETWRDTALNENDEVEMLVFVGGG